MTLSNFYSSLQFHLNHFSPIQALNFYSIQDNHFVYIYQIIINQTQTSKSNYNFPLSKQILIDVELINFCSFYQKTVFYSSNQNSQNSQARQKNNPPSSQPLNQSNMKINESSIMDATVMSPHRLFGDFKQCMESMGISPSLTDVRLQKKTEPFQQPVSNSQIQQNFARKRKDIVTLKKLIQMQKIKKISRKFIQKLKLNIANSPPVQFQPYNMTKSNSILKRNGFQISDWLEKFISFLIIINILICVFVETTHIAFPQIVKNQVTYIFLVVSLAVFIFEFFSSLLFVKMVEGKKLLTIGEIAKNYFDDGMIMDLAYLIVLMIDLIGDASWFRLIILFKLPECFARIQKIENSLINTFYKEQYWGLTKVFLLNFFMSHILSILLILMSELDLEHSWMTEQKIYKASWYEQYIWAFYWGTTIMLTVGFGDITPANSKEAICIVIIETFSCLCLAYNINCVGNLISNIKSQDVEKNRNIKTFKMLSSRNNLSQNLEMKIHNYIEESTKIRKKFNFQEESNFILTLPRQLKADFLKESNKKIFQGLTFFKDLTQITLLGFAETIQMKICHPEEIIRKRGQVSGAMILKEGKIGLLTRLNGSTFSNCTIQTIQIKESQKPFLLSLDFICNDRAIYEVKSEEYSILYYLDRQKTLETLRTSELDYEHFCFLRDRSKHLETDFEVFWCENCKSNHSKFDCPKLHYCPLKKHVIDKYIHSLKTSKSLRQSYQRQKNVYKAFTELSNNLRYFGLNSQTNLTTVKYTSYKLKSFKQQMIAKVIQQSFLRQDKNLQTLDPKTLQRFFTEIAFVQHQNNLLQEVTSGAKEIEEQKKVQFRVLADYLKDQLEKLLSNRNQVWLLECDEIKDFKFYFVNFNPSTLHYLHRNKKATSFFQ